MQINDLDLLNELCKNGEHVRIEVSNGMIAASFSDFIDIAHSPLGLGDTVYEALMDLATISAAVIPNKGSGYSD